MRSFTILVLGCLLTGCGEAFTVFDSAESVGVGGADIDGAGAGSGGTGSTGSGGAGGTPIVVGAGGSVDGCEPPDGWFAVTPCDDDPGLLLGVEVAGPVACSACACAPWQGYCSLGDDATLSCWEQAGCSGTPVWESASSASCQSGPPAGPKYCQLELPPAVGGCEASGGESDASSPWVETLGLCDGCGCLVAAGDVACPRTGMTRAVGHADAVDQRGCSECECSAAETCIAGAAISNACDGLIASTNENCSFVNFPGAWIYYISSAPPSACEAAGGLPTGEVEPVDPWTVCCEVPL